jgi:4-amino-4-deoxy-L-arabinose transferase-like glycosyltransferase
MALHPVFPFFGRLLTGAGGAFAALLAGGVLVWIAWALFRLKRSGWWATGLGTLVIAVSSAWTLIEIPRADWYRALEYPERQIERLLISGEPPRWPGIAAISALTILTLVYLMSIRRHFRSDGGR